MMLAELQRMIDHPFSSLTATMASDDAPMLGRANQTATTRRLKLNIWE